MARKKTEEDEVVVEKLVPVSQKLVNAKGQSLELLMWRGEISILVDGKTIVRYTTLAQQLSRATVHQVNEVVDGLGD
jgi:hypothetical protein